jgi:hypothetical protein
MGELSFQISLARFLTDPSVRDAALATHEAHVGNASGVGPDTENLTRLRLLDRGRTAVFSELLLLNRVSKITEGLPWTTALLGARLWPTADEFNRSRPPTHAKKVREAIAFAEFLEERFSRRPPEPPFLADVLVYEAAILELRHRAHLEPATPVPDGHRPAGPDHGNLELGSVPFLLPGSQVVALQYDVESIGQAIGQGEPPASAPQRPICILLRLDQSGVVHQDEINLPTLLFIQACDGTTSLEAISTDLAAQLGQEDRLADFHRLCLELGASLVDRTVLGFRPS